MKNVLAHTLLLVTASLLLFSYGLILAQPHDVQFNHIGLEQGLSQSTVYAIVQDAQDFMWFGTQDGLNRYDGYSIKVFRNNPADSTSLSDNTIWSLLSDKEENLWIGTERGGLNRYVSSEDRFYRYIHAEGDTTTISDNFVRTLYEDSRGNIWQGTQRGVNRFEASTGTFVHYRLGQGANPGSGAYIVNAVCEDANGNMWVGTQDGLFKLSSSDLSNGIREFLHVSMDRRSPSDNDIRSLRFDRSGVLWVGTGGEGLYRFDEKTGNSIQYGHKHRNPQSASDNFVTSLLEDSMGLLWVGTNDGGLSVFNREMLTFERYGPESVVTIYQDRSGILWIGTFGSAVKVFDRRKNKFTHFSKNPGNPNDAFGNVYAIIEDRDKNLWIGTWGNGIYRFDREKEKVVNISSNPKLRNGLGALTFMPSVRHPMEISGLGQFLAGYAGTIGKPANTHVENSIRTILMGYVRMIFLPSIMIHCTTSSG